MLPIGRIISAVLFLLTLSLPLPVSAQLHTLMPLPTLQDGCHLIVSFDVASRPSSPQ
jgi:hypothetical protein